MRQILQDIRPMNQSGKYRQAASECYEGARVLSDPREKAKMLAMAQSWILLADQAARNSHLKAATTGLTGHGNRPGLMPSG
jgi:hypothetical protein